jgi:hypothetical protein
MAKKDGSGTLAGRWIKNECERRRIPFHQAKLGRLVRMGYLEKRYASRGGSRRYYRVMNAEPIKPSPKPTGVPPQPGKPGAQPPFTPKPTSVPPKPGRPGADPPHTPKPGQ